MESSRVYIVDDDESVRSSLSFLLQSYGIRSRSFADGEQLLGEIERLEPGIILLDLRMAGRNGTEVQEELAQRGAAFPVVAMTGADDAVDERRSVALGAIDMLRKPFDEARLLSALARARDELKAASG